MNKRDVYKRQACNGAAGGLKFKSWDTADLAGQLKRLVTDDALHGELAKNAPIVAANFSVARMTDRVLEHLGLPMRASS